MLTRREALAVAWAAPRAVPAGVTAVIQRTLHQPPGSLNTDWFATLLLDGLLKWDVLGVRAFAEDWLGFHLTSQRLSPYSGAKSRTVEAAGVSITTYAGQFGTAFPCFRMARMYRDERARRVVLALAGIILNRTSRNRFGMVNHDDAAEFAIPDTCYFVAPPLMLAASLDPERGWAWREQALYQLRTYTDVFLARDTGLAKTILLKEGLGRTYWTRASGWLLWALTGVLRHLPEQHPEFAGFAKGLAVLAAGLARVQDASGALRLYLNDPASPLETSGTLMCARGLAEAVRRHWLPASYGPVAARAWQYVLRKLAPDGALGGVYTGWAMPAEHGGGNLETVSSGWAPGMLLSAAAEM